MSNKLTHELVCLETNQPTNGPKLENKDLEVFMKLSQTVHKLSQIETIKRFTLSFVILMTTTVFAAAPAQPETSDDASMALEELQEDLNVLKYFAERIDLGRILVLEKKVSQTNQLVKEKGLGNLGTLNSYQDLVLAFKYSETFMKSISTRMNESTVVSLGKKLDTIITARGFDQSMNSQLVAGILSQVHNITQQIQTQQVSDSLVRWMKQDLAFKLGTAIATAKAHGDIPASFAAADQIYREVSSHYGELYQINHKNPAYNMVTELMGLMEFYKDISTRGARSQEIK